MSKRTSVQTLSTGRSGRRLRMQHIHDPREDTADSGARASFYYDSDADVPEQDGSGDQLASDGSTNLCCGLGCPQRLIPIHEAVYCRGKGCSGAVFHVACIEKLKPWWSLAGRGGLMASSLGEVSVERDLCSVCWRALGDDGAYGVLAPLECWDGEGMPICECVMDVRLPKKARDEVKRDWEETRLGMLETASGTSKTSPLIQAERGNTTASDSWPTPAHPHNNLHKWLVIGEAADAADVVRSFGHHPDWPVLPRREVFMDRFNKRQIKVAMRSLRAMCVCAAQRRDTLAKELGRVEADIDDAEVTCQRAVLKGITYKFRHPYQLKVARETYFAAVDNGATAEEAHLAVQIASGMFLEETISGGTRRYCSTGPLPTTTELKKQHRQKPIARMPLQQLRNEIMLACEIRERLLADADGMRERLGEKGRKDGRDNY